MALQDDLRDLRARPAPGRVRRRWDLVAAWCVILGPLVGIAIWLGFRQRVGDLEERLVRDANAAFSRTFERPVHVDAPLPGTFGDAVARHLPAIQAWSEAVKGDEKALEAARGVVDGTRPLTQLPPAYAAALETLAAPLDGLLAGTHAERAELPLAREGWRPSDGTDWNGYQAAALLAGLRARRALVAADVAGATELCLDGLALGREAAITSGMLGHMTGVAAVKRLIPPCADAIERLDAAERGAAVRRLRTIRDAFPSVAEMLRVEFLGTELLVQRSVLSASANRRLVPRALAYAAEGKAMAAWERLVARDAWRGLRRAMDAMLRVAGSASGDELQEGMRSVGLGTMKRINPLIAIAMPNYGKFARRAEGAVRRLDALVVADAARTHREREGRWPESVAALAAGGMLAPEEAARSAGIALSAAGARVPLELRLELPSGDESPPEELLLRIKPPGSAASRRAR